MKRRVKINCKGFWGLSPENSPFYKLLSKRFHLEISDDPDFLLYTDYYREEEKYRNCVRIFYTGENKRPDFYDCDYAFSFDLPMTERHYRLPLYRLGCDYDGLKEPKDPDEILAQKSGFCSFLSSHATPEREDFFQQMLAYKRIDSGGSVLNTLGYKIPVGEAAHFQRRYKFAIVFENSSHPGYTTEKIVDAMLANTVPIYWGNPRVAHDFNTGSFINCHDYDDFSQVIEKVIEMDNDDDLYKSCLSEPWLNGNRFLDYLTEESLLARFEKIFSSPQIIRYPKSAPLPPPPLFARIRRKIHEERTQHPAFSSFVSMVMKLVCRGKRR